MLNRHDGNLVLIRLIRAEIAKRGPVSFAWFMQQALYHPEHGYYSSGRCAIGRKGDYFTNVSVGPIFGQLLCAQFAEIWERLGRIDDFVVVEQAAHHGQFAHDVLQYAQQHIPKFFATMRYQIVEPFAILKEWQLRTLESFRSKIEWHDSLQPFVGVHFSNELLDAMPVRLISGGAEKFVGTDGEQFVFVERPVEQDARFNDAALDWTNEIAANLQRGCVIAIDYGRCDEEFQGNVQVRAQHRSVSSPFEQVGHADITMHVDWRSVAARAQANGLTVAGFTDQHHFLTGILAEFPLAGSEKSKRALQTLLHPELLGRAFQVLALKKNVADAELQLAGFKFAREPYLGL